MAENENMDTSTMDTSESTTNSGGDNKSKSTVPTVEELQEELTRKERLLAIANREAQERRAKLDAYEKAEADKKNAEMTELERIKKELESKDLALQEKEMALNAMRLRRLFGLVAEKLGIKWPSSQAADDAFMLADLEKVAIDENGKADGLEEAIKQLQKDRPYLFAQEVPAAKNIDSGSGRGSGGVGKKPDLEALSRRYGI